MLTPDTDYFEFTTSDRQSLQVRRTQFAIISAAVRIVYGAQGESLCPVIVDLVRPPNMGTLIFWLACYVMLSRAPDLENLLILRNASREELNAGAPAFLVEAVDRLLDLERKTAKTLHDHLAQFEGVLPAAVLRLFQKRCL